MIPRRVRSEREVNVPGEPFVRPGKATYLFTDDSVVVPELTNALVYEDLGDAEPLVARKHRKPDDVDREVGIRVSFEDLLLHRTGARTTRASGR